MIRAKRLALGLALSLVAACATPVGIERLDPQAMHHELTSNVLSTGALSQFTDNMAPGDPVGIALDVRPGEVFPGVVESVGWGVDTGEQTATSGLPVIRAPTGWLREAQRFPVRVRFETDGYPQGIRYGSQASLVVYTGDGWLVNGLASLWLRLVSWLSYLY